MLGLEGLSNDVANLSIQMREVRNKLDDREREQMEALQRAITSGRNVVSLNQHNAPTSREIKAIVSDLEELRRFLVANSKSISEVAAAVHSLQGIVEGVADDLGSLMAKVDEISGD